MNTNELTHHGIKGMKWGVRRTEKQLARVRAKAEKEGWSDDAKEAAESKAKGIKRLSNSELRKLNERERLEQEYARLNPKHKSAGRQFCEDVVKESGKELAKEYAKKGVKLGVTAAVKAINKKKG